MCPDSFTWSNHGALPYVTLQRHATLTWRAVAHLAEIVRQIATCRE
jgi:hypothetical protein